MLLTAFITGLVGSLHCVGMCGPIALALPRGGHVIQDQLVYNLGRTVTYSMLGAVVGIIGFSIRWGGLQQVFSVAMGVSLLILALFSLQAESRFMQIPVIAKVMVKLRKGFGKLMGNPRPQNFFAIGLLNGLLPCGFVYLALAGAATQGHWIDSVTFMACFGLGTLPLMLGLRLSGQMLPGTWRAKLRPLLTGFAVVFACILIMRGLSLDIPYLSPVIPTAEIAPQGCG